MGLEKYNVAPDDKGGRPEKEEEDYKRRGRADDPLTQDKDNKEFLQSKWDDIVSGDEATSSEIQTLCSMLAILPRTLKEKVKEYGIGEFDGDEETEYSDMPEETSATFGDGEDSSSGFASIIENAKE